MKPTRESLDSYIVEAILKRFTGIEDDPAVMDFYRSMGWAAAMSGQPRLLEVGDIYRDPRGGKPAHPFAAPFAEGWDDFHKFASGELALVPEYVRASDAMG